VRKSLGQSKSYPLKARKECALEGGKTLWDVTGGAERAAKGKKKGRKTADSQRGRLAMGEKVHRGRHSIKNRQKKIRDNMEEKKHKHLEGIFAT